MRVNTTLLLLAMILCSGMVFMPLETDAAIPVECNVDDKVECLLGDINL